MEESKRQISQYEKTFESIINNVISNFKRQITKDPFRENFVVHLVNGNTTDPNLEHVVKHGQDPSKLLFYLTHFGLLKISGNASLQSNFSVDKVIRITYHNMQFR
ncbi:hypothetical protein [Acinetobacter phage AB1I1M-1]